MPRTKKSGASKHRLIVYLHEGWPESGAATHWVTLDERNRIGERGYCEPRHWPAGACTIVLAASECVLLNVKLPAGGRREEARLLRYALEDQLMRDIEEQHLTVTQRHNLASGGSHASVLVVARTRLRQLLAQLKAIGREPQAIFSELQLAATATPAAWALTQGVGGSWMLARSDEPTLACDADSLADLLAHLHTGDATQAITVHQTPEQARAANNHLPTLGEGIALQRKADYQWWQLSSASANLLHDEFRPAHDNQWRRTLAAPLWLAATTAAVWLVFQLGDVLWQRHQFNALEERMTRIFSSARPGVPPVAPAWQLRRALDEARSAHGQLRENDFLALLASYADALGGAGRHSITRLDYSGKGIELELDEAGATQAALLAERLRGVGYQVQTRNASTLHLATTSADGAPPAGGSQ